MDRRNGIDVSEFQGVIDWEKVKGAGVEFAIIRCGYGSDIESQDDKMYKRNVAGCEEVEMPYGVYLYSYAANVSQARSEAKHVLRLIQGRKLTYPVFLDMENNGVSADLSSKELGDIAEAFCDAIINAGYNVGIYSNVYWFDTKLTDKRFDKWARWVAQYSDELRFDKPYVGWQYTSTGKVDGIEGYCDKDYFYKDYEDNNNPETPDKKTIDEIAREVIAGKWGTGNERRKRLEAAGYDYDAVQKRVNELLALSFDDYKVKITTNALNIRSGPGTDYSKVGMIVDKGIYTIVDQENGKGAKKWGKLKSGAGWISLDYTKKI